LSENELAGEGLLKGYPRSANGWTGRKNLRSGVVERSVAYVTWMVTESRG